MQYVYEICQTFVIDRYYKGQCETNMCSMGPISITVCDIPFDRAF